MSTTINKTLKSTTAAVPLNPALISSDRPALEQRSIPELPTGESLVTIPAIREFSLDRVNDAQRGVSADELEGSAVIAMTP
jgi:hypothetical protein